MPLRQSPNHYQVLNKLQVYHCNVRVMDQELFPVDTLYIAWDQLDDVSKKKVRNKIKETKEMRDILFSSFLDLDCLTLLTKKTCYLA